MKSPRIVLITGATGGIGGALAEAFLQAGDHVVLAGRRQEALEARQAELGSPERTGLVVMDVADPASIHSALQTVHERWGHPEILVNNAGIAISAPLRKGEELAEAHMAVNYHGPRRLLEACLPDLLAQGRGHVVQIASSAGLYGYSYTSAYCASKHALLGYTRAASLELRSKGIALHTLCPHFVDSPMTQASIERIQQTTGQSANEARAALEAMNPDGCLVAPEQIADLAVECCARAKSGDVWELTGEKVEAVASGFALDPPRPSSESTS